MRVNINLIIVSNDPQLSATVVLLNKGELPVKNMANKPPEEVAKEIFSRYVDSNAEYYPYELRGYTHDVESGHLNLYFYTFLPWPVPLKKNKGKWHIIWSVFREEKDTDIFHILQGCSIAAAKHIQTVTI